jgi:hypothetical protein
MVIVVVVVVFIINAIYFSSGGMLGLFCGASFLSLFEIVFWLLKALLAYLTVNNGKNTTILVKR